MPLLDQSTEAMAVTATTTTTTEQQQQQLMLQADANKTAMTATATTTTVLEYGQPAPPSKLCDDATGPYDDEAAGDGHRAPPPKDVVVDNDDVSSPVIITPEDISSEPGGDEPPAVELCAVSSHEQNHIVDAKETFVAEQNPSVDGVEIPIDRSTVHEVPGEEVSADRQSNGVVVVENSSLDRQPIIQEEEPPIWHSTIAETPAEPPVVEQDDRMLDESPIAIAENKEQDMTLQPVEHVNNPEGVEQMVEDSSDEQTDVHPADLHVNPPPTIPSSRPGDEFVAYHHVIPAVRPMVHIPSADFDEENDLTPVIASSTVTPLIGSGFGALRHDGHGPIDQISLAQGVRHHLQNYQNASPYGQDETPMWHGADESDPTPPEYANEYEPGYGFVDRSHQESLYQTPPRHHDHQSSYIPVDNNHHHTHQQDYGDASSANHADQTPPSYLYGNHMRTVDLDIEEPSPMDSMTPNTEMPTTPIIPIPSLANSPASNNNNNKRKRKKGDEHAPPHRSIGDVAAPPSSDDWIPSKVKQPRKASSAAAPAAKTEPPVPLVRDDHRCADAKKRGRCKQCKVNGWGGQELCDDHLMRKETCLQCFDMGRLVRGVCKIHRKQFHACGCNGGKRPVIPKEIKPPVVPNLSGAPSKPPAPKKPRTKKVVDAQPKVVAPGVVTVPSGVVASGAQPVPVPIQPHVETQPVIRTQQQPHQVIVAAPQQGTYIPHAQTHMQVPPHQQQLLHMQQQPTVMYRPQPPPTTTTIIYQPQHHVVEYHHQPLDHTSTGGGYPSDQYSHYTPQPQQPQHHYYAHQQHAQPVQHDIYHPHATQFINFSPPPQSQPPQPQQQQQQQYWTAAAPATTVYHHVTPHHSQQQQQATGVEYHTEYVVPPPHPPHDTYHHVTEYVVTQQPQHTNEYHHVEYVHQPQHHQHQSYYPAYQHQQQPYHSHVQQQQHHHEYVPPPQFAAPQAQGLERSGEDAGGGGASAAVGVGAEGGDGFGYQHEQFQTD